MLKSKGKEHEKAPSGAYIVLGIDLDVVLSALEVCILPLSPQFPQRKFSNLIGLTAP